MRFKIGDQVYIKSINEYGIIAEGPIEKPGYGKPNIMYFVEIGNKRISPYKENMLSSYNPEDFSVDTLFKKRRFEEYYRFRQYMTYKRLTGELTNVIYSFINGNVEFLPYQFKPVLKFIKGVEQRLLIADEVGLGKTIESLYIWRELQIRYGYKRLLIVSPSMLCDKWASDIRNHFGLNARVVDVKELYQEYFETRNDNNKAFVLIVSIQGLRAHNKDLKEDEEDPKEKRKQDNAKIKLNKLLVEVVEDENKKKIFDLVIFDEAHNLKNPTTSSFHTARRVLDVSESAIFLTATPINNGIKDLFYLLQLLCPEAYSNLDTFMKFNEANKRINALAGCFYNRSKGKETVKKIKKLIKEINEEKLTADEKFYSNIIENLNLILFNDKKRRKTFDEISEKVFYSPIFTRSRKKDVLKSAIRSAQTANFILSDTELQIYKECLSDLQDKFNPELKEDFLNIAIITRLRELSSSLVACLNNWKSILNEQEEDIDSSGLISEEEEAEFEDLLNEKDISEIEQKKEKNKSIPICVKGIVDSELRELEKNDSKFNEFLKIIKQKINVGEGRSQKIVVFSFFRNTLKYLKKRLSVEKIGTCLIIGGMSRDAKNQAIEEFKRNEKINILLSSEVGAEGLDLQFSNLEINYDIPWNPMRLEQRIGRIDRIGQKSEKINIINFTASNTIEDRILEVVYEKINIFESSIGGLEDILGKLTKTINYSLLSKDLTPEQKEDQINREINRIANIENSRETLEEDLSLTHSFSDSILDYVNQTERQNRYIRDEDLIFYVQDFLEWRNHGSIFREISAKEKTYSIELSNIDRIDFNNFILESNLVGGEHFSKIIRCSFNQTSKANNANNIDITHPLIKWISHCFKKEYSVSNKFAKKTFSLEMSHEAVSRANIKPGLYSFLICEFSFKSLKRTKELFFFAKRIDDESMCSKDESEYLLSQAIFCGNQISNQDELLNNYSSIALDDALMECNKFQRKLFYDFSDLMESENNYYAKRLKNKLELEFEAKRKKYKEKIEDLEEKITIIQPKIKDNKEFEERLLTLENKLKQIREEYKYRKKEDEVELENIVLNLSERIKEIEEKALRNKSLSLYIKKLDLDKNKIISELNIKRREYESKLNMLQFDFEKEENKCKKNITEISLEQKQNQQLINEIKQLKSLKTRNETSLKKAIDDYQFEKVKIQNEIENHNPSNCEVVANGIVNII